MLASFMGQNDPLHVIPSWRQLCQV